MTIPGGVEEVSEYCWVMWLSGLGVCSSSIGCIAGLESLKGLFQY